MRTARIVFASLYHVHCVKMWSYFSARLSVISAILQIFSMLCVPSTFVKSSRPWRRQQVSDHGRCSACPRANLSYTIAKVRLPPFSVWKIGTRSTICRSYPAVGIAPPYLMCQHNLILMHIDLECLETIPLWGGHFFQSTSTSLSKHLYKVMVMSMSIWDLVTWSL